MADTAAPLLIGQKGDLPKKERYTTVSVTQGYTERVFNGIEGMTTRKIRICGVKLIWDEYENTDPTGNPDEVTAKLFHYSGSNDIVGDVCGRNRYQESVSISANRSLDLHPQTCL